MPGSANGSLPALVVAGTASGVGKTSVATGLMRALVDAGHVVQGAKVGPDYIDPSFHALATGRPPRNLDPWLSGADLVAPLARHAARAGGRADVLVVEGMMGMLDGIRATGDEGSSAHVARLLGAPVLLVLDASAMARSAAAVVHGFATFDPDVEVRGVVLNRVGSAGHADLLREAIAPTGVPVVGALPEVPSLATPSRHLGLVPVAEWAAEADRTVAALGGWVAEHLDLDAVVALARTAEVPDVPAFDPAHAVGDEVRGRGRVGVAVAGGPAFSFRYAEHAELLAAAGAELLPFDPMADDRLPPGTAAILLGGGFPEVHAEALAANRPMREAIAAHAAAGGPVVAECGGLAYLCRSVDGVAQAGVLDAEATMGEWLTLGYREAVAAADSVLWRAGEAVRAHEFHRTSCDPPAGAGGAAAAWLVDGREEGHVHGGVHASYLHTHWASTPQAAVRLVEAASAWQERQPQRP